MPGLRAGLDVGMHWAVLRVGEASTPFTGRREGARPSGGNEAVSQCPSAALGATDAEAGCPARFPGRLGRGATNSVLQQRTSVLSSLEARAQNPGASRATLPLQPLGKSPSWPRPAVGGSRCSLACGCITSTSASAVPRPSLLLCLLFCLLRQQLLDLGPTGVIQSDLISRAFT